MAFGPACLAISLDSLRNIFIQLTTRYIYIYKYVWMHSEALSLAHSFSLSLSLPVHLVVWILLHSSGWMTD